MLKELLVVPSYGLRAKNEEREAERERFREREREV